MEEERRENGWEMENVVQESVDVRKFTMKSFGKVVENLKIAFSAIIEA